jgi:hypothetical protein
VYAETQLAVLSWAVRPDCRSGPSTGGNVEPGPGQSCSEAKASSDVSRADRHGTSSRHYRGFPRNDFQTKQIFALVRPCLWMATSSSGSSNSTLRHALQIMTLFSPSIGFRRSRFRRVSPAGRRQHKARAPARHWGVSRQKACPPVRGVRVVGRRPLVSTPGGWVSAVAFGVCAIPNIKNFRVSGSIPKRANLVPSNFPFGTIRKDRSI